MEPVGVETVNTVSLLATVCDTLSVAYGLLFSAGLSECRFSVPAPVSGGVVSLTLRKKRLSQNHIPSSRSFSCNRHLGSKKAGTSMCADRSQKDSLIPLWCWFHIHVTGFEIQSRNCQLRFLIADSSKQFRSSGISFSHTAGVYGAKPYSQILWRYVIGCGSHKRVLYYTEWNKCLSTLSEKVLNIFSESGNTI